MGLQRPQSWARIGGVRDVQQATFDASGNISGYRFTVALGGNLHGGTATRSAITPGRRVAMVIDTDQLGGEIDVELEPQDEAEGQGPPPIEAEGEGPPPIDKSAVTVAMTVHSKGFMASMLFPMITGAIASSFNEEVERFASGLAEVPISPPEQLPHDWREP